MKLDDAVKLINDSAAIILPDEPGRPLMYADADLQDSEDPWIFMNLR